MMDIVDSKRRSEMIARIGQLDIEVSVSRK